METSLVIAVIVVYLFMTTGIALNNLENHPYPDTKLFKVFHYGLSPIFWPVFLLDFRPIAWLMALGGLIVLTFISYPLNIHLLFTSGPPTIQMQYLVLFLNLFVYSILLLIVDGIFIIFIYFIQKYLSALLTWKRN